MVLARDARAQGMVECGFLTEEGRGAGETFIV